MWSGSAWECLESFGVGLRSAWEQVGLLIGDPVLTALSKNELKKVMPGLNYLSLCDCLDMTMKRNENFIQLIPNKVIIKQIKQYNLHIHRTHLNYLCLYHIW